MLVWRSKVRVGVVCWVGGRGFIYTTKWHERADEETREIRHLQR